MYSSDTFYHFSDFSTANKFRLIPITCNRMCDEITFIRSLVKCIAQYSPTVASSTVLVAQSYVLLTLWFALKVVTQTVISYVHLPRCILHLCICWYIINHGGHYCATAPETKIGLVRNIWRYATLTWSLMEILPVSTQSSAIASPT